MKKARIIFPFLLLLLTIASCGGDDPVIPPNPQPSVPSDSTLVPDSTGKDSLPDIQPEDFARGADISWYSQMEDEGKKFYSWNHREPMDCPAVMHDLGLNTVALRLLVNPTDGYCGLEDVLEKAERVHQLDMDLLLSLHLSDTIATNTLQRTPKEWQGHDFDQLLQDVQDHITSSLQTLTEKGIHPRWVQIGNQLSSGLLWPEGDLTRHASQYTALVRSACLATRQACPYAMIIISAGSSINQPALCNVLDGLRSTDYDQIGLMLYPSLSVGTTFLPTGTAASYRVENENDAITFTMQTIDMLYNRYRKPSMIVECGVPVSKETASSMYMRQLVLEARNNNTCRGVIYHEPEAYEGWMGYTQGAFLSNGRPTQIIDALTK